MIIINIDSYEYFYLHKIFFFLPVDDALITLIKENCCTNLKKHVKKVNKLYEGYTLIWKNLFLTNLGVNTFWGFRVSKMFFDQCIIWCLTYVAHFALCFLGKPTSPYHLTYFTHVLMLQILIKYDKCLFKWVHPCYESTGLSW